MTERATPGRRSDYVYFTTITTRWRDNDAYGHVNNVTYYSFFDTIVHDHLQSLGLLDIAGAEAIGLVVASACRFHAPLAYPMVLAGGLRVQRVGRSSVTYEMGVFDGDAEEAAAEGSFTHIYVARDTRRSTPIPTAIRAAIEGLMRP